MTNQLTAIDVSGRGQASRKPDMATLSITVTTKSLENVYSAGPAVDENSKIMQEVLKTLADFEVEQDDLKTAVFQVHPEFDGSRNFVGFSATNGVDIKMRNTDKVGLLCAALLQHRAVKLGTPIFKLEDPKVLEVEARDDAFNKAKNKAEQLASLSGLKITGVAAITDGQTRHSLARSNSIKSGQMDYFGSSSSGGYSGCSEYLARDGAPPLFEQDESMSLDVAITFIATKV